MNSSNATSLGYYSNPTRHNGQRGSLPSHYLQHSA